MSTAAISAVAALDADDFDALVRASVGKDTDPAVWDALTDPAVIARTKIVLGNLHTDVQNQLSLSALDRANGGGSRAEQAEWRRRAAGFLRLVDQRLALVKSRTLRPPQQASGSRPARQRYAEALEKLARAVAAHQDRVLSGEGDESDDDTLWDCLDQITVAGGSAGEQSLADWLAYLDKVRAEDGQ